MGSKNASSVLRSFETIATKKYPLNRVIFSFIEVKALGSINKL